LFIEIAGTLRSKLKGKAQAWGNSRNRLIAATVTERTALRWLLHRNWMN
jgi:hypothetical protein